MGKPSANDNSSNNVDHSSSSVSEPVEEEANSDEYEQQHTQRSEEKKSEDEGSDDTTPSKLSQVLKENIALRHELDRLERELKSLQKANNNKHKHSNDEDIETSPSPPNTTISKYLHGWWTPWRHSAQYSPALQQTTSSNDEYGDDETGDTATVTTATASHMQPLEVLHGEEDEDEGDWGDSELRNRNETFDDEPFKAVLKDRTSWLIGLLVFQSCSSFILEKNEDLLQSHLEIVHFLTMLVGAGGNAGNQACVRVIRGLAVGNLNSRTMRNYLWTETKMTACISAIMSVSGLIRAALFGVPLPETLAITTSLFAIVAISIFLGAVLPLSMKYAGIDPAHSSTTIQVVMDILGVTITCAVSQTILETAAGKRFTEWLHGAGRHTVG